MDLFFSQYVYSSLAATCEDQNATTLMNSLLKNPTDNSDQCLHDAIPHAILNLSNSVEGNWCESLAFLEEFGDNDSNYGNTYSRDIVPSSSSPEVSFGPWASKDCSLSLNECADASEQLVQDSNEDKISLEYPERQKSSAESAEALICSEKNNEAEGDAFFYSNDENTSFDFDRSSNLDSPRRVGKRRRKGRSEELKVHKIALRRQRKKRYGRDSNEDSKEWIPDVHDQDSSSSPEPLSLDVTRCRHRKRNSAFSEQENGSLQQQAEYEHFIQDSFERMCHQNETRELSQSNFENVNLSDYDMCEISVEWHLPRLAETNGRPPEIPPIRRVFGINAGMTLFNIHRIISISMRITDEAKMSQFNHVWVLPNNNTYGGGPLTKARATCSSRLKVTTDRSIEYRHSVTCSLDSEGNVVPRSESVLLYVFGCVQMQVQLLSVIRDRTKQNSLVWVPRCIAVGTYGNPPPPGTDWNNPDEVGSHIPELAVNVHEINAQFIDTRFSKNTSHSRRTKMIRASGIDHTVLRSFSESIHEFWKDPERVRDYAIRITRQSLNGNKHSLESSPGSGSLSCMSNDDERQHILSQDPRSEYSRFQSKFDRSEGYRISVGAIHFADTLETAQRKSKDNLEDTTEFQSIGMEPSNEVSKMQHGVFPDNSLHSFSQYAAARHGVKSTFGCERKSGHEETWLKPSQCNLNSDVMHQEKVLLGFQKETEEYVE